MFKYALIILLLSALAGDALSADARKDIAVIYNKRTRINRDTVDFIYEQFKRYKTKYNISDFQLGKADSVNVADYKAIILLNTGVYDGIDERIIQYIDSCKEKSKLILITLLKDNKELKIESLEPSPATHDIDAITGPTVWKGRGLSAYFGGKNSREYEIHVEWIKRMLFLLEKRDN
jgi:hypothetical protein